MPNIFTLTTNPDIFNGQAGDDNFFDFTSATLQSVDLITGGATGSFIDVMRMTAGGTVAALQFLGVTNIEELRLSAAGNVTLANGLVAGSSNGYFLVQDSAGDDTVDGSGISNGIGIAFFAHGGTDTFTGGNGNDSFSFTVADLTSADTVVGGAGVDTLNFGSTGTVLASAFTNVSGMEALRLNSGGNNVTLTDGLVGGTSLGYFVVNDGAGNDTVDASGVTNNTPIAFIGSGGTDTFSGGNGNDAFYIPDSAFAGISGNAGLDRIILTTPGQSFNLTANNAKITNTEIVSLSGSAAASLTLADTDIPLVNAATNLLYVVGEANDSVTAGAGWTVVAVNFVNNAVAPGHTFTQYHSTATNSDLFIDSNITPTITATPTTPVDVNNTTNSVFETAAHTGDLAQITASAFGGTGATVHYSITADSSGTGFTIGEFSGIVTVADGAQINYETAPGNAYSITVTATSGGQTSSQVFSIAVADVNDAPTLSATPLNLGFTEGGAAVDLFSTVAASAIEAGQNLNNLVITVSNVAGTGATESLTIDGTVVALNTHSQVTAGNGLTANVSLSGPGGTATVTLSKAGGVAAGTVATIVDALAYGNTSNNPGAATRVVTLTSVSDTGGTANLGIDTTALTLHSDVAVTTVNSAPSVAFGAINGFTENGSPTSASSVAVTIAPNLTVSDVDSGNLTTATFVLNNLKPSDALSVSGHAGASGDIGGIHFVISSTATTETVTFTNTDTIANYNAALHLVQFNNTSDNPDTTARSYTVTAVDDGTGTNTGSASTTETVTAVNDAPLNNGVPASFTVESGFTHAITGLSIADLDDGGANDITTTLTSVGTAFVTIGAVGGGAVITNNGTNAVTLTGTTDAINLSLGGSVVYTAADNVTNSPTTTLTIATNDQGHTGTPGGIIDTDVISVGVTPQVWFINSDQSALVASDARGSQFNPFSTVAEFNAASLNATGPGDNDYIYVKAGLTGTYSGEGINLKPGQTLLGDDQALSVVDPFGGPNIVIEDASGARPTIHVTTAGDQGIDVASGNTIRGINIQTDANNSGLDDGSGANNVGTLTVSNVAISGVGKAVDLDGSGTLAVTLDSISSTGATADGIDLTGMGGSLTVGAAGTTISNAGTTGIHVQNSVAGSTFNFGNTNVAGAAGTGVDLASNAGNVTFADLDINGDVGARSLLATGNTGTLTSTSGTIVQNGGGGGFAISGATTLNMTLDSLNISNTSVTGIDLNQVKGNLTVGTTTIASNTLVGVQVQNSASGSTMDFGNTTVSGTHSLGAVRLGTAGNGNVGNITFDDLDMGITGPGVVATANTGITTISAGTIGTATGTAIDLTSNAGGTFNLGGGSGGVDITTTGGTGFNATGGATINVTGASNTIQSGTGQVLNWNGVGIGASNATFASLQSTGTVAANAINLLGVDNNTFNGGNVTVAGTGAGFDGISISGGSSSAFNFNSATIGGNSNNVIGDDGIDLNGANGAVTFTTVTINGTTGAGIETTNNTNAININGGNIGNLNDSGGIGVDINNGSGNIVISPAIAKASAGDIVEVSGRTGTNTVAFHGNITASSSGGVDLSSNSAGTTTTFDGGLNLATGTNTAFNANAAGTVTATDPGGPGSGNDNVLSTSSGIALNVIGGTTIGASGLNFKSISSSGGAPNGIVLNNTGTSGHLTVTGTGTTAGSGGTIQGTTGDGVSLTDTQDVNLSNMTISDNAGSGINGLRVNGVVLTKLTLNSNADTQAEAGILFNELTGNASHATTFSNLTVSNSFTHNVQVINSGGVLPNLAVSGSTFSNDGSSNNAGSDFIFESDTGGVAGTPTMTLTANNNTFTGNNAYPGPGVIPGTGLFIVSNDGTVNAHIGETTGNTFNNLNNGINLTQSSNAGAGTGGNLNFTVRNNTVTNSFGNAINVFSSGDLARTLDGIIQNNTIGTLGVATSGSVAGEGIRIGHESLGVAKVLIDGNTVQSIGVNGVSGGDSITVTQLVQAGTVHATVTNNIVRDNADSRGITVTATKAGAIINADVHGNTITNVNNANFIRFVADGLGAADGTINVPQASELAIETANGGAPTLTDARTFFNQPAPLLPAATPQFAAHGQGPGGFAALTPALLAPIVAQAIAHWAEAGATPEQIALLNSTHVTVEDLSNGVLGNTNAHGIQIDADAAGWGWFVDATPADNSEFHATSSATELAATGGDAAAHVDLLTVIEHELGHIIGLEDSNGSGVMNVALDVGERRLPDATDVAQATPVVAGNAANNTVDAGHGGNILFGGAGADNFVFGPGIHLDGPTPSPITHVADYSAAQGDTFDFSALTSAFHNSSVSDSLVVRAVEDASGKFAMLQVDHIDPMGLPTAPNWVNVAQLDGAHAGDSVNVLIDTNHSVHLAQIHVDLLV